MRVALFPDTNVVMHFKPFDQIDWCVLAKADEVTLVVTAIVMREVDEKKNSTRGHIQKRARKFSSWLRALPDVGASFVRDGVMVEIRVEEPELALDFAANGLVPTVGDDRLIAAMLVYAKANPTMRCVCLTDDTILVRKAGAAGFEALALPDAARVQEEPDARDLEIRELRDAKAALQRRLDAHPQFSLSFPAPDVNRLLLRFGRLRTLDEREMAELLDGERSMLELRDRLKGGLFEPPSRQQVDRYLSELRDWLPTHVEVERQRMLTTRIEELTLQNIGAGNGEDIEVTLRFPEHIHVAERRALERQPRPEPPVGRDRLAPLAFEAFDRDAMATVHLARLVDEAMNPQAPTITEVGPHELVIVVRSLKHHDSRLLDAFDLWFESADDITDGAKIRFKIHASTPPVVEDELHLLFEVNDWGVSLDDARRYRQR